jgi:hypothetical protein
MQSPAQLVPTLRYEWLSLFFPYYPLWKFGSSWPSFNWLGIPGVLMNFFSFVFNACEYNSSNYFYFKIVELRHGIFADSILSELWLNFLF